MFLNSGYQIFENIFSDEDIKSFQATTTELLKCECYSLNFDFENMLLGSDDQTLVDAVFMKLFNEQKQKFDELLDRLSSTLAFRRLITSIKIENAVNECFGGNIANPLSGYLGKFRTLMPSTDIGRIGWHREIFQTVPRARFVQIWAPLFHSTSSENGSLEILENSHVAVLPKPKWRENKNGVSGVVYDDTATEKFKSISINLKPGQALFFDGRLIHRSGKNLSSKPRYSIVGLYHDATDEKFIAPHNQVVFRGETPKEYFDSMPDAF